MQSHTQPLIFRKAHSKSYIKPTLKRRQSVLIFKFDLCISNYTIEFESEFQTKYLKAA